MVTCTCTDGADTYLVTVRTWWLLSTSLNRSFTQATSAYNPIYRVFPVPDTQAKTSLMNSIIMA